MCGSQPLANLTAPRSRGRQGPRRAALRLPPSSRRHFGAKATGRQTNASSAVGARVSPAPRAGPDRLVDDEEIHIERRPGDARSRQRGGADERVGTAVRVEQLGDTVEEGHGRRSPVHALGVRPSCRRARSRRRAPDRSRPLERMNRSRSSSPSARASAMRAGTVMASTRAVVRARRSSATEATGTVYPVRPEGVSLRTPFDRVRAGRLEAGRRPSDPPGPIAGAPEGATGAVWPGTVAVPGRPEAGAGVRATQGTGLMRTACPPPGPRRMASTVVLSTGRSLMVMLYGLASQSALTASA